MDLWVVVGAAAAGYIAKYWQNLSMDRDSLSELSSKGSNFEKPDLPSCPIRRLVQRKKLHKDASTNQRKVSDEGYKDTCERGGGSAVEVTSTSEFDGENLESLGNYENCNFLSISTLSSGFLPSDNPKGNDCDSGLSGDIGGNDQNPSTNEMGSFHGSARNKSDLSSKISYQHLIRPLNSLESCLMAQLYQKHTKMEEYVLSSLPSPSKPTIRQLFVTDGSQIISRASTEFHNVRERVDDYKLYKEACLEKNENLLGVSQLPQTGSVDFPKKMKFKSGKGRFGRLSISSKYSDGSYFHSQGSQDAKTLFCLGISIGIISSFIANRSEVDKLKELLKQTENLVQDLQEELEMKDSLTVKELANENNDSLSACDNSFNDNMPKHFCLERSKDNLAKHDGEKSFDKNAEESIESMSQIEAELEAELVRMGLNMNSSSLERRLSDFVELDPDFEADFAHGELKANMIDRDKTDSNQDASGSSTHHSGNYAVSPRELSMRLHEVIESRLEERVKELETALENSQRKVQLMESQRKSSWRKFSNSPLRFSLDEESKEECNAMAEPLVMNLSGEALDAYNEAFEELMKIDDSEEENSPSGDFENNHQIGSHPFDQSVSWVHNGIINGSSPHTVHNKEKILNEVHSSQRTLSEECSLRVQELLDVGMSGDESSDCEGEMEKQLIKQIVEKTKKGSPVVLNAQKWLFLMDEDKH
ncbi:hypothetical protein KPL71_007262 [Citrus sinensis]|uniref:Uncharacterized protein n=1 Tax=Citrus sinensis TaxID=2711 RepID=A0ACB8LY73_CITSI|nr:hypothetical protein KPL71_007262 [Citrus sinensis]